MRPRISLAFLAVNERDAPPGTRTTRSRWMRHTAWVRNPTSSKRRFDNNRNVTVMASGRTLGQVGAVQRGQRDRVRVGVVGLAALPAAIHPHQRGPARRHVQYRLAFGDESLRQVLADTVAALDGPGPGP